MVQTIQIAPGASPKASGLETWMRRVLTHADKVEETWDADAIHDLRVALRRCRTMADALSQVNPDPLWRKLKKATRALFHSLGALRDTQMDRVWIKKLWPAREPLRLRLLRELSSREAAQRDAARRSLAKFDRKDWKRWSRKASSKAEFFPVESIVFQRLALASLNECVALFEQARKRPSVTAWHRARIGLKRFRYVSENFLPHRYEAWAADVKRLQDLLGEVHDLDVLCVDVRKTARAADLDPAPSIETIQRERATRLNEVAEKTAGAASVFPVWRTGFLSLRSLAAVPAPMMAKRRTA